MGDHGADVVLLESCEGHPTRSEAPFLDDAPGPERSLLHAYANANKRSALLAPADGRRQSLLQVADVLVVSDRESAEAARAAASPAALVVAVTPYGLAAPEDAPGNDLTTSAVSGWALINGDEGGPPLRPTLRQSDYLAGLLAYTGTVAALVEREQSGAGQVIDVSELEPPLWMAAPTILAAAQGDAIGRGRARPGVFSGPVPTRDGYFSVTFSRPHFWTEAMHALGLEDLATDPRYLDRTVRQAEAAPLQERIEGALAQRGRWELFDALAHRRATVGVVLDMKDIATSTHLEERDVFSETVIDGRPVRTLASPCVMSGTPWRVRTPAPRLGEHTDEVLSAWLGQQLEGTR